MRHCFFLILLFLVVFPEASSQVKPRKLPVIINHPSLNLYAPYISFDGNALVFISDNAEDFVLTMFYTSKENADWKEPVVLPKIINSKLNFLRGYALSAEGKRLYFSSMKAPVVGGYDIVFSDLKGTSWTEAQNLAVPINTKGHEASPSFTPEGNTLYFMRCEKMDQNKAENCKIFSARKKSNGQWEEPIELPSNINSGNSQAPRIMADGETLLFSSNKLPGNKGGMDLYISKLKDGSWTNPTPLDFVNTDKDDQYISVSALGRNLLKDSPGVKKNELVECVIPNELRPRGMMKVDGKVTDPSIPAFVSIVDLTTNKRIYNGRSNAEGSFLVYLMEGSKYELSVDPEQSNISFFTKKFDLTVEKIPQFEKVNAILKSVVPGDEMALEMVQFKPYSSELDLSSNSELKRLARMIKSNLQFKFEIQVLLNGYAADSIRSTPDLTEVVYDSIQTQYDEIDSLGQLYKRDTLIVKTTYHNDRSADQAQAVINFLVSQGIDAGNLSYFRNAIPATIPENKKIAVMVAVRPRQN